MLTTSTLVEKLEIEVIQRVVEKKWSRVASTMATMLMDSLPEPLVRTEIVAKRRFAASEILHTVMRVYQPGGTNEKTSILAAIANIGESATAEGALENLRAWRRKTLRAKELKLYLPDPSLQYKALLAAVEKIRNEDRQLKLRLTKFEMKLETSANFQSVGKFQPVFGG